MPKYTIYLSKKAEKNLNQLPERTAETIFTAISDLENNPRPVGYKKLKGRDGFRIRCGSYRIIYEIFESELVIDVINLGHRKNIYKL
jgi:mRNA interferase RelE/StbE